MFFAKEFLLSIAGQYSVLMSFQPILVIDVVFSANIPIHVLYTPVSDIYLNEVDVKQPVKMKYNRTPSS